MEQTNINTKPGRAEVPSFASQEPVQFFVEPAETDEHPASCPDPFNPFVSAMSVALKDAFNNSIRETVDSAIEAAVDKAMKKYSELCKPVETYTRQQVCEVCHISLPTFHAWVKDGSLKTVKMNGRTLVRKEDLESLMRSKRIVHYEHKD